MASREGWRKVFNYPGALAFVFWFLGTLLGSMFYIMGNPIEDFETPPDLLSSYKETNQKFGQIFNSDGTLKIKSRIQDQQKRLDGVHARVGSVVGTTWSSKKVYPPKGTSVDDWNILVGIRDTGKEEKGSEKDNAILRVKCKAWKKSKHWDIECKYKYRVKKGDGDWKDGLANWILISKKL